MSTKILTAGTVITMDPARPRAEAVVVSDGRIAAVGSVAECREDYPDAELIDTGVAALLPGLVEPHSHPVMSGVATQPPARSIAPWDAPAWSDVEAIFADAIDPYRPEDTAAVRRIRRAAAQAPVAEGPRTRPHLRRPGRRGDRQLRARRVFQHRGDEALRLGRQSPGRTGRGSLQPQPRRKSRRPGLRDAGVDRRRRTDPGRAG